MPDEQTFLVLVTAARVAVNCPRASRMVEKCRIVRRSRYSFRLGKQSVVDRFVDEICYPGW